MKTAIPLTTRTPHDVQEAHADGGQTASPKKPFVRPVLTRHATLPAVTAAFFGSFRP
jgi:hypothetical protein